MIYVRLSKTFPLRQSEWMLALAMFALGIVYAASPGLFEKRYFAVMVRIAPQWAWASAMLLVGFTRLVFLAINGALQASPHMRSLGASIAALIWLQLTLCAAANEFIGQTMALWPCFFLFDAFAAYTAAREARASDDRAKSSRAVSHGPSAR